MSAELYAYPYDPTGVLPGNKIKGERHTLSPSGNGDYNFIVPKAAPFFATAVRIRHVSSDALLIHGVDYYFSHSFDAAKEVTPEDVFGSITFIDSKLSGDVVIDYRTMGGPFTLNEQQLMEVLAQRHYDPRALVWGVDVIVPLEFPASPHLTDGEDLVGMDDTVNALAEIEKAIRGEADLSHTHTKEQVIGLNAALDDRVPQNGPRKYSMSTPINVVENSAPIFLHMPNFLDATDFNVKVIIIDPVGMATLSFHGRAPGQNDNRVGMLDWPVQGTIQQGHLSSRSMTYEGKFDSNRVPYIAMSVGTLTESMIMITEVTINSTYSRAYSKNWVLTLAGGNDYNYLNRFTVADSSTLEEDRATEGTLQANSIWLIDSTEPRVRTLPDKPPHKSICKFKDDRNLCVKNPAVINGRFKVNNIVQNGMTLDRSNGWFTAQYNSESDTWSVTDGG